MPSLDRPAAEERIERALLEQWDPLGVASAPGEHPEYQPYAHELYNLLARGASDVQIGRYLHRAEDGELGHPELASRDPRRWLPGSGRSSTRCRVTSGRRPG